MSYLYKQMKPVLGTLLFVGFLWGCGETSNRPNPPPVGNLVGASDAATPSSSGTGSSTGTGSTSTTGGTSTNNTVTAVTPITVAASPSSTTSSGSGGFVTTGSGTTSGTTGTTTTGSTTGTGSNSSNNVWTQVCNSFSTVCGYYNLISALVPPPTAP